MRSEKTSWHRSANVSQVLGLFFSLTFHFPYYFYIDYSRTGLTFHDYYCDGLVPLVYYSQCVTLQLQEIQVFSISSEQSCSVVLGVRDSKVSCLL